ncbi:hypothetical protein BDN72DRAFT_904529 [Pluteus cervinus]|uniref:Uncharacterized protein n=1 Tax=Pluteus cervinus TaxID=181527 RepID=A0ACD3A6N9_9AGAR|nr:hypothetical protein BDN72DRAFT_904529 [Pluteus cervinus]
MSDDITLYLTRAQARCLLVLIQAHSSEHVETDPVCDQLRASLASLASFPHRSNAYDPLASVLSPERWANPILRDLVQANAVSPTRRGDGMGIYANVADILGRSTTPPVSSPSPSQHSLMATSPDLPFSAAPVPIHSQVSPSTRLDARSDRDRHAGIPTHPPDHDNGGSRSTPDESPLSSLSSLEASPPAQISVHETLYHSDDDNPDSSPLSSPPASPVGSPPSRFTSRSSSPTLVGGSRGVSRASSVTMGGSRSSSVTLPKRVIAPLRKRRTVTQSGSLATAGAGSGSGGHGGHGGPRAINLGWVDPNCPRNGVGGQVEQPAPLLELNQLYPIAEGGHNEPQQEEEEEEEQAFWGNVGGGEERYEQYEEDHDEEDHHEEEEDRDEEDHHEESEAEGEAQHDKPTQASSGTGENWDALPGSDVASPSVAETQVLSRQSCAWISNIATLCRQILSKDSSLSDPQIALDGFNVMFEPLSPLLEEARHMTGLNKLAFECYILENSQAGSLFQYFIRAIIFRLALHNESIVKAMSFNKIYETMVIEGGPAMVKLGVKTLERLGLEGSRYCLLMGGGTVYLLALLARISSKSELSRLDNIEAGRIATLLKAPHPRSAQGKLIINDIIPAIAFLREMYKFSLPSMMILPIRWHFSCPPIIDCRNVFLSDLLLDSLGYNNFIKGRDSIAWRTCLLPLKDPIPASLLPFIEDLKNQQAYPVLSSFEPQGDSAMPLIHQSHIAPTPPPALVTFSSSFDPKHKKNTKTQFPRGSKPDVKEDRALWTEDRIGLVRANQVTVHTKEELQARLTHMYPRGYKEHLDENLNVVEGEWSKAYTRISQELIKQLGDFSITNKNGGLVCAVWSSMPRHIQTPLFNSTHAIFGHQFNYRDSERSRLLPFDTYHFSVYNRYAVRGKDYDPKADPSTLQRKGKKTKANTCTFIPRHSTEIRNNPIRYGLIQQSLAPVFTWIDRMVHQHLPEDWAELKSFVDSLPGNQTCPASPFAGFVINLNVATQVHRDWNDNSICVVLVISDPACEGGELVLEEPGLVLDLKCGDVIVFPSSQISHFNLHFKGWRASLVCHSDRHSVGWLEDFNGWVDHLLFRTQRGVKSVSPITGVSAAKKSKY